MIPKQQKQVIPYRHYYILTIIHINFDMGSENLGTAGIRGTAIYVKNDIPSVEMKILDSTFKDNIWVEILLNKTEFLLCGCIYRSPTSGKDETITSLKEVEKVLSAAVEMKKSHLIIAGDFNLKAINWEIDFAEDKQHHLQEFINVLHDNFLYQHVRQPTRHRLGENSNILDLVFGIFYRTLSWIRKKRSRMSSVQRNL